VAHLEAVNQTDSLKGRYRVKLPNGASRSGVSYERFAARFADSMGRALRSEPSVRSRRKRGRLASSPYSRQQASLVRAAAAADA